MPTFLEVIGIEKAYQRMTIKYLNAHPPIGSMEEKVFATGSAVFDSLLSGYEGGVLTTIYGPSGTGKTTVCILAAIVCIRSGKKVIFVDTEGGFSTIRFQQLLQGEDAAQFLEKIFLLKPMAFADQRKTITLLKELVNENIGLIIVDSISMLYRAEVAKQEGVKGINAELGLQIFYLNTLARKYSIPVLMTSQVYADFEEKDRVKMVGGDILKYGSKCLIELEKYKTMRKATVIKHRSIAENRSVFFEIVEAGFLLFEEPKKVHMKEEQAHRKSVSEQIAVRFPELKEKEFEEAADL